MSHEKAKKLMSERLEKVRKEWDFSKTEDENLEAWDFSVRSKTNPEECPCYTGKPCHKGEINCLLCFCPEYDLSKEEGGCKRNGSGKYIETKKGKIWDCSDCDWPHKKENIKRYLKEILK